MVGGKAHDSHHGDGGDCCDDGAERMLRHCWYQEHETTGPRQASGPYPPGARAA